jgi:hypothetical protein
MTYQLVNNIDRKYAVDWDVIERICRSYWLNFHQLNQAKIITTSDSSWYNPFSWSLPYESYVDIDWDRVRSDAASSCAADMFKLSAKANKDMRDVAYEVEWKLKQTYQLKKDFAAYLKKSQSDTLEAMKNAESDYQGYIEAAKFIRDTSTDVVMIGAQVATGGTGVALLAGASFLKGTYKYQDTGNLGAAALYGGGSLFVGAFKINGAKLTSGGEYTLIVVQGVLETSTSLVAGDSFTKAIGDGALKIASAGTAQAIFGNAAVTKMFQNIPVPFTVMVSQSGKNISRDEANKFLEKTAKKLTEKMGKIGLKSGTDMLFNMEKNTPNVVSTSFINDVPLEQSILLNLSIVDLQVGLGGGLP